MSFRSFITRLSKRFGVGLEDDISLYLWGSISRGRNESGGPGGVGKGEGERRPWSKVGRSLDFYDLKIQDQ